MPTTGLLRVRLPADPLKLAPPKVKIPPSEATIRYPGRVTGADSTSPCWVVPAPGLAEPTPMQAWPPTQDTPAKSAALFTPPFTAGFFGARKAQVEPFHVSEAVRWFNACLLYTSPSPR